MSPAAPIPCDLVERFGFTVESGLVSSSEVEELLVALASDPQLTVSASRRGGEYAARNLLGNESVAAFCRSQKVLGLLSPLMNGQARPVRAILFDKVAGANWRVGWHQDQMIPVRERIDTRGFTAWSVKAGLPHVRPPAAVLERMLTLRLHLDDCGSENGPLRVLPGSHRSGYLSSEAVWRLLHDVEPVDCCAKRGDALLMRPLLLHASSKAVAPSHRRVLHVEFASETLPGGLSWPSCSAAS